MIRAAITFAVVSYVAFGAVFYRIDYEDYVLPDNDAVTATYALDFFEASLPFSFALDSCSTSGFTTPAYYKFTCSDATATATITKDIYSGATASSCTGEVTSLSWNSTQVFSNFLILLSAGVDTTVAEGLGWSNIMPMKYSCTGTGDNAIIDLAISPCSPTTVFKTVAVAIGNAPCTLAPGGYTQRTWCTDNSASTGGKFVQLQFFNVSTAVAITATEASPVCTVADYTFWYTAEEECTLMFVSTTGINIYGKISNCTQTDAGFNPDVDSANTLSAIVGVLLGFVALLL